MYKKTKPRSVMELLHKNLSEREVAIILGCSRNSVASIIERCRKYGKTWDDIKDLTDDQAYDVLYPTVNTDMQRQPRTSVLPEWESSISQRNRKS